MFPRYHPPDILAHKFVFLQAAPAVHEKERGEGRTAWNWLNTFQWRHNECDGVSNHQPHGCLVNRLFNRLFRRRSKNISKLRVTGLCGGNSPATGEFPAQRASNAENVFIWWRHYDSLSVTLALQLIRDSNFVAFSVHMIYTINICRYINPIFINYTIYIFIQQTSFLAGISPWSREYYVPLKYSPSMKPNSGRLRLREVLACNPLVADRA